VRVSEAFLSLLLPLRALALPD